MMKNLQLHSMITQDGYLELFLQDSDVPDVADDEVVIQVHASPINPSDMGGLFASADLSTMEFVGSIDNPKIRAAIPNAKIQSHSARLGKSIVFGNEGAGVVVVTGQNEDARALMGQTVAVLGGAMYQRYRVKSVTDCLKLKDGTTPREGASCFVNPLTALGMVETMRMEGHSAIVHTAAASNLGQMLQKLCLLEGVDLVNIVRNQANVDLLKGIGASYVCNTNAPNFSNTLTDALVETGATLAFDALGGGELAGQILASMEGAISRSSSNSGPYGSSVHKQIYIYGNLDRSPTTFNRSFGFSWGMGGYLLGPFLKKIGDEAKEALKQRVASEITTTFASSYEEELSLRNLLNVETLSTIKRTSTGRKYLLNPSG